MADGDAIVEQADRRSMLWIAIGLVLLALGIASWLTGFDLRLEPIFRLAGGAYGRRIAELSALGGSAVMGAVGLVAVAVLLARRRVAMAIWLLVTVAGGRLVVEALKPLIARPRPQPIHGVDLLRSWSFPSSHSAGTMMTCLALALVCGGGRGVVAAALLAAAVIGWSRIALGVHWPGDVLAGWGFGLAWAGFAMRLLPAGRRGASILA